MSEALHTNPTVNNLNKVEGFDPSQYLRTTISDVDGSTAKYLDVKYRKLWFRLQHPSGKITKRVVQLTEQVAVIEARVYLDKDDPAENYLSSGLAMRLNSGNGFNYLESAETAAEGRALSGAGYGSQFCDILEADDPDVVDAPISIVMSAPVSPAAAPAASFAPVSPAAPVSAPAPKPAEPTYTEDTPLEDILAAMTLEQAKTIVVPFPSGDLKGKSLGQLALDGMVDRIKWIAYEYRGKNNILRAGAQLLLKAAMDTAS